MKSVFAAMAGATLNLCSVASSVPEAVTRAPITDGFDFPVGPPDANGYYDAQPFGRNQHLGSDWNGNGGGNSDLGDPVYSIGHGRVRLAEDKGTGWGRVVVVTHRLPDVNGELRWIESLYAHLDTMTVNAGQILKRGERIGTIGDAHGAWVAHLHFEIRTGKGHAVGRGYGPAYGQIDPTAFIQSHRH